MDKPIASLEKTQHILKKYNFYAKKKYGQNFIIDSNVIRNIVQKSAITNNDIVIEIGPGIGSLTEGLSAIAHHVYAFEIDNELVNILNNELSIYHNITIIAIDFLKVNLQEFIAGLDSNYNVVIIANLPYYITSAILTKIITAQSLCQRMILMMQEEVGLKLLHRNSDKEKSALSYISEYYCEVEKLLDISKNVFIPRPNIESVVLQFTFKANLSQVKDDGKFIEVTKALLSMRRKTIQNNLNAYLNDKEKGALILTMLNIPFNKRAEELELNDFINITNIICTI